MRNVIWAAVLLFTAIPASAQVPVPYECQQLAIREGFPTDQLTKTQAARAKLRMSRLSDDDPIVRSCRAAILELKRQQGLLK